ncbi:MAG: hypothetical protein IJ378_06110 [Alistipes sp.]|nr:hypothetical protein [Alistipes sp.]
MKKILLFASAVAVLFSSCSTDSTSDVIGNEAKMGAVSATAAYQQDGTRTEYDGQNVLWSKGDAIGIFNADGVQVQFGLTEGAGTATGKFEGNTNYLTVKEPAVAYYPYDKNTTFAYGVLSLEIAGKQTFLKADSWDAAMAPAIGYTVVEDKDDIKFKFEGVASYVTIPVKGMGTLKSLSLNIGNQQLYGTGTVDFNNTPFLSEEEGASYAMVMDENQDNHTITVNCGGNVKLDPFNAQKILFVIPAGVNLHQAEITVTAELVGAEKPISHYTTKNIAYETKRVTVANAKANLTYEGGAWSFGMEDAYLVYADDNATPAFGDGLTAEERFLAYAYLTKPGAAEYEQGANLSEVFADYIYAAKALKLESSENIASLEAQIYEEALDFAAYTEAWAQTQYDATSVVLGNNADDAAAMFWKKVYAWYKGNKGAIESLAYNAVNGTIADDYVTISNLTVKGNGISAGASLSGLKFENIAVVSDAKTAGLIAESNKMSYTVYNGTETNTTFTNIMIGEGNSVSSSNKDALVGGILGRYYTAYAATTVINSDYAVEIDGATVGQLFGDMRAQNDTVFNLTNYFVDTESATPIFAKITSNTALHNVSVNGQVAPATVKNCNVAAAVNGVSLCVNGTYYWNGGVATEVNLANGYSAEELAYAISQGAKGTEVVLTNDIDMQCSINFTAVAPIADDEVAGIVAPAEQYVNLDAYTNNTTFDVTSDASDGEGNNFEIKNLIAVSNKYLAALFGKEANISNVTLSNVTLYVAKSSSSSGEIKTLAGIAETGTAKDVTINGLAINVASDANITATSIGGVFATATPEAIENVTVSALAINGPVENLPIRAGIIAGTLNVAPTTVPVVLKGIKLTGAKADYAVNNFGELYKHQSGIEFFKVAKNYAGAYPFGTIYVSNASFPKNAKGKAYVGVDEAFETYGNAGAGQGNRLAAGVVFANGLTRAAEATVAVSADGTEYDYAFELTGGVRVGNTNNTNFFGFTAK